MSSLSTLIKNIYTFGNILSQAGTEAVSEWDDRSLQNACNWASYCMKIEEQTRGKLCRSDLDRHVRSLTILYQPVNLLELTLDNLQDALGLLAEKLCSNPYSPSAVRDSILKCVADSGNTKINRCIKEDEGLYKLHQLLDIKGDNQSNIKQPSSLGGHVIERLIRQHKLNISNQNRFNRFLEKLTFELACQEQGWPELVHVLLTDVTDISHHGVVEHIKQHLVETIISSHDITSCMWQCKPSLLCELSTRDDSFLCHHTHSILSWGGHMEPVYGHTTGGQLYSWRYKDNTQVDNKMTYNDLVHHITVLLHYNNRLSNYLEPKIVEHARMSYFNIWKDLLKETSICDR